MASDRDTVARLLRIVDLYLKPCAQDRSALDVEFEAVLAFARASPVPETRPAADPARRLLDSVTAWGVQLSRAGIGMPRDVQAALTATAEALPALSPDEGAPETRTTEGAGSEKDGGGTT